jgi:hypothetical protein
MALEGPRGTDTNPAVPTRLLGLVVHTKGFATLSDEGWQKASKSLWSLQRAFGAAQGAKRTPQDRPQRSWWRRSAIGY